MASIWRCMAEGAIEGLKIRTFGPRSGVVEFAAIAGHANSTAIMTWITRLPHIGSHRFFGQGGGEPPAVVFHVEGLGKVGRIRCDQHDLAVGSKKCDRGELLQFS